MNTRLTRSLIVATLLLLCIWLFVPRHETMTSTVFCAYGTTFIEFDHDGYLWGTIMLDHEGKPVPCEEEGKLPVSSFKNFI